MGWVDVIADDGVSWHRNSVGRYPSNFKTNPGYHGIVGRTTKRTAFATGVKIKGRSAPQPAFDEIQVMSLTCRWRKERGARVQGSRPLDELKVQAPCVARVPAGGYRLFYTGIGPTKPYAACQGYILSAVSHDGVNFDSEPGIRVAPQPALPHMALRVLARVRLVVRSFGNGLQRSLCPSDRRAFQSGTESQLTSSSICSSAGVGNARKEWHSKERGH